MRARLVRLSEGAIVSDWVEREVIRALDEEGTRKQIGMFPVRLDDPVMQTSEGWASAAWPAQQGAFSGCFKIRCLPSSLKSTWSFNDRASNGISNRLRNEK
jgi:hypothetical protein